ncbi:hypothetical protein ACQU0X_17115 [Pseudovibrio ascidiaceicola]|uniref:hypothetical protein n=1 Tax=Pseudovibrio ascidiaceicola TaxID=285279 RepID=UPI003D3631E6
MFSRKTRKGLLGGVALTLAGLMAGEAGASGGVLFDKSLCSNSLVAMGVYWAGIKTSGVQYSNQYYMKANGDLVQVAGSDAIGNLDNLLIVAHGSCGSISGQANKDFVDSVKRAAGDDKKGFDSISALVCQAAANDGKQSSLLSMLQDAFPTTKVLEGFEGKASLVGAGNVMLSSAVMGGDASVMDGEIAEARVNASNITNQWTELNFRSVGSNFTLGEYCKFFIEEEFVFDDDDLKDSINLVLSMSNRLFGDKVNDLPPYTSWNQVVRYRKSNSDPLRCGTDFQDDPFGMDNPRKYCKHW